MLEILAQRDKVIPNEFFTWMGLNKKMKLFFLDSDTLSKSYFSQQKMVPVNIYIGCFKNWAHDALIGSGVGWRRVWAVEGSFTQR